MGAIELLTLSEVSTRSGVSLPTLQRYKNMGLLSQWQKGEERKARFTPGVVRAAERLRNQGLKKRGRAKKQDNEE